MASIEEYRKIVDNKTSGFVGTQKLESHEADIVVECYDKLEDPKAKKYLMAMSPFTAVMFCMKLSDNTKN